MVVGLHDSRNGGHRSERGLKPSSDIRRDGVGIHIYMIRNWLSKWIYCVLSEVSFAEIDWRQKPHVGKHATMVRVLFPNITTLEMSFGFSGTIYQWRSSKRRLRNRDGTPATYYT